MPNPPGTSGMRCLFNHSYSEIEWNSKTELDNILPVMKIGRVRFSHLLGTLSAMSQAMHVMYPDD